MQLPDIRLQERRGSHWYEVDGHGTYPSVTTVLGATRPKPFLAAWKEKQSFEKMKRLLSNRAALPDDLFTMSDEMWQQKLDALIVEAKAFPLEVVGAAADLGSRAHKAIERYLKGEPYEITQDIKPCFEGFLNWQASSGIEITGTEQRVFCPQAKVAGSIDVLGQRGSSRILGDFKTSKAVYNDHALQLAGYALCWESMTGEPVEEAWIIRLAKDPNEAELFEAKMVTDLDVAKDEFLSCRRSFERRGQKWFK